MNTDSRAPRVPESYATFWEPVAGEQPPATPVAAATSDDSAEMDDAYLQFVNVTEGASASPPAAQT